MSQRSSSSCKALMQVQRLRSVGQRTVLAMITTITSMSTDCSWQTLLRHCASQVKRRPCGDEHLQRRNLLRAGGILHALQRPQREVVRFPLRRNLLLLWTPAHPIYDTLLRSSWSRHNAQPWCKCSVPQCRASATAPTNRRYAHTTATLRVRLPETGAEAGCTRRAHLAGAQHVGTEQQQRLRLRRCKAQLARPGAGARLERSTTRAHRATKHRGYGRLLSGSHQDGYKLGQATRGWLTRA